MSAARIHVALRPERLRIAAGASSGVNTAPGTVTESAYRGGTMDHHVRLRGGAMLLVSQPLANGMGAALLTPGSDVAVSWPPEACVLLPE